MRSEPRGDDPRPLKELLGDAGKRLGFKAPIETGIIWSRWTEIVGASVAQHAHPSSLRKGTLRVLVDAPAWATEIDYLGSEIAARANAIAGADVVHTVRAWTSPEAARRKRDVTVGRRDSTAKQSPGSPTPASVRSAPEDPETALARAREAWRRSASGASPDSPGTDLRRGRENPEKGR